VLVSHSVTLTSDSPQIAFSRSSAEKLFIQDLSINDRKPRFRLASLGSTISLVTKSIFTHLNKYLLSSVTLISLPPSVNSSSVPFFRK